MDKIIVAEKLADLRDRVERIEGLLPERYVDFAADRDANELVELNFCRAIQICVDIAMHAISKKGEERPASMADAFDSLLRMKVVSEPTARTLKGAVRIRNFAMHTYAKLDLRILYRACTRHLGEFQSFAAQIRQHAGIGDRPRQGAAR